MNAKNDICFFGLLHITKNENVSLNFKSQNDVHKILVYLKNAITLDQQLKRQGYKFVLITNEFKYLNKLLKKINYKLKIKEIKFKTFVPKNTHFYACHFRVDVYRYLSSLKKKYSILLDLDVLILKKLSKISYYRNNNINLVNDITNNVIPAYGKKKILKSLQTLDKRIKKVKWYGGDFFSGNYLFFKILYKYTKFFQKKLINNIDILSDQTDELFMSVAINEIKNKKKYIVKNTTDENIFTRYWNTNVKHNQKQLTYYKKFNILHIPADKIFLSNCYDRLDKNYFFRDEYFAYVCSVSNIFKKKISQIMPIKIKKIMKFFL